MSLRDYKLDIKSNKNTLSILVITVLSLMLWILVSFTCAFFTALLLTCVIWNIEARYPLTAGLVFICAASIILAFNQHRTGDLIASWGFFFFAAAVIIALIRLLLRPVEG
ncbi:MAG: hypothetical protein JXA49_00860 [Actinobacteria bacterium]|nr:hypothetical protein [Actinomycetota bacterium]